MALMVSLPLFMLLCALFLLGAPHPNRLYFSYYVVQNANSVRAGMFLCVFLLCFQFLLETHHCEKTREYGKGLAERSFQEWEGHSGSEGLRVPRSHCVHP